MRAKFHREFELCSPYNNQLTNHRFDRRPVIVVVGEQIAIPNGFDKPDTKTFHVHEDVLGASSIFLQDALKGRPGSPSPVQITLPTVRSLTFQAYVNWLYTGRLYITGRLVAIWVEWPIWTMCYKLANLLQNCAFKDSLIDTLVKNMTAEDSLWLCNLPGLIYSNTTRESPHRKLVIDLAVHTWSEMYLENQYNLIEFMPPEFHLDLIAALGVKGRAARIEHVSVRDFFKDLDTCMYHEHRNVKVPYAITPCYKIKYGT